MPSTPFSRFDIVSAYWLYYSMFTYHVVKPNRSIHNLNYSTALQTFKPSLTLVKATRTKGLCVGTRLPKNSDYEGVRDAYARLLRRQRQGYRLER